MLIKQPIITEKTIRLAADANQYTFEVTPAANKLSAAREIEKLFDVKVVSIQSHIRPGKTVRFGKNRRQEGRRSDRKIMVFKLNDKDSIEIFKA